MATINVEVKGANIDCIFMWGGSKRQLIRDGDGSYSGSVTAEPGTHLYSITVFGTPGNTWSAKLTGGVNDRTHMGHFSPANVDGSGDTFLEVK